MRINHNISALTAHNALNSTNKSLFRSLSRLSTGLRVNGAADDAAGLAISEKMRAQHYGLTKAEANAQDGISMIKTAEGALGETHAILQRMRELSLQAANDTLTQQDRAFIQLEIDELASEIDRISATTQFNRKKLLDGSAAALWSSDNSQTKAIVNGGLRQTDAFGQKSAAEGNYILDIIASAGKAQVQKSDIFKVKHKNTVANLRMNSSLGVSGLYIDELVPGDYSITVDDTQAVFPVYFSAAPQSDTARYLATNLNLDITNKEQYAFNFKTTVTEINEANGTVTVKFEDLSGSIADVDLIYNIANGLEIGTGSGSFDVAAATAGINLQMNSTSFGNGSGIDITQLTVHDDPHENLKAGSTVYVGVTPLTRGTWSQGVFYRWVIGSGGATNYSSSSGTSDWGSFDIKVTASGDNIIPPDGNDDNMVKLDNPGTLTVTVTNAGTTGTISLNVAGKIYERAGVSLTSGGSYDLSAPDSSVINITLSGTTGTLIENDTRIYTVNRYNAAHYESVGLGSFGFTTQAITGPATSIASSGILTLRFGSGLNNAEPASDCYAELNIGGDIYTATNVLNGLSASPPTTISLSNGTDTITLDVSNYSTITPPTNGSEITMYVNGLGFGGEVPDSNTLSVADLARLITFEPTEDLDTRNTFMLRVRPDYDPSIATGNSITFDLYTYNRHGDVIGVSEVTITEGGETQKVTIFDADANEIEVDFKTQLNWDGPITPARLRAGDQATFAARYAAPLVGRYDAGDSPMVFQDDVQSNASLLLEVVSVNDNDGTVEFQATASILRLDGTNDTRTALVTLGSGPLDLNSSIGDPLNLLGLDITLALGLGAGPVSNYYRAGSKLVYNISPEEDTGQGYGISGITNVRVAGVQNPDWPSNWIDYSGGDNVTVDDTALNYALYDGVTGTIHFRNFYVDEGTGKVYNGDIALTLDKPLGDVAPNTTLATFTACYVGQVAPGGTRLRDLDKFWDANGKFMFDAPQTLTIAQGGGGRASVTLYADDTLEDAAQKLNAAIGKTLGQETGIVIGGGTSGPFVSFVNSETAFTSEAARGTFVIRSAVTGEAGKLNFSGDEDIIKALSLNTLQQQEENTFTVTVSDAHSGKLIKSGVKIAGNKLAGAVNANVDVVFDPMANLDVSWNDLTKAFVFTRGASAYRTVLHLADNTTTLQIGANEGEDMVLHIGDMSASSLKVSNLSVTDRESSARSVTSVDNAIARVSAQRARLGAYQNRLEHTVTNLATATANTVASESRIRDADMASEMVNFTKLNILSQAGNSMLAQANQMPSNILSLLR